MLTPNQKYALAIDRATDMHRHKLGLVELEILLGLADFYREHGYLTAEQKRRAYPILAAVGLAPAPA